MVQRVSEKISELPELGTTTSVPSTAIIPVVINGVTYRATKEELTATATSGLKANSTAAVNKAILQAAYDALNALGGGTLEIGAGTFALSGNVQMYANIHTRMSPGTVLDISAAGAVDCLYAVGTEGSTMALTANAAKGATSIIMSAPNAATLSQGKWIRIASDSVFNASDTNSKIGELAQVKSVAGTTVNLEGPLRGGPYNTANNATASLVTPVENIRVSGGKIKGGGTVTTTGSDADCNGIRIFLGSNCSIESVRFERCD